MQIVGWGSVVPITREYGRGMSEPVFSRKLKEAEVSDRSQADDCDHKQNICLSNEKTGFIKCGDLPISLFLQSHFNKVPKRATIKTDDLRS